MYRRPLQTDLAMSLDFEADVSPRIRFLVDLGIRPDDLGEVFTKNPHLFKVDLGEERFNNVKPFVQLLQIYNLCIS
jgi:hypothetical protein